MRQALIVCFLLLSQPVSAEEICAFFDGQGRNIHLFLGDAGEFELFEADSTSQMCSWDKDGVYCDSGQKPPIKVIDDKHFEFDGALWEFKCFEPA